VGIALNVDLNLFPPDLEGATSLKLKLEEKYREQSWFKDF
jgi:hypothetical protein